MSQLWTTLRGPLAASTLLLLPLLILEWVNRRPYGEPFPLALFALLWLLPAAFALVLQATVRAARPARAAGLALLFLIAGLWLAVMIDQMPCFLGVANCD